MKIEGLTEAQQRIKQYIDYQNLAVPIIERYVGLAVERAKELSPVESGELRDSIRQLGITISRDLIETGIESPLKYASFIEAKEPYLRPALEEQIDPMVQEISEIFR